MGRTRWGALGVALLATLSGCFWPTPGGNAGRTAHNALETQITPANVGSLDVRWEAAVGGGPAGAPVTSTAGIHVADTGGLSTFAARDGALLWEHPAPVDAEMWQPYVAGDQVLASQLLTSDTATALRLDARTGAVEGEIPGGLVVALRDRRVALIVPGSFCTGPPIICLVERRLQVRDLDTGATLLDGRFYIDRPVQADQVVTLGDGWVFHAGMWFLGPTDVREALGVRAYSIEAPVRSCGPNFDLCPTWQAAPGPAGVPVLSDDGTTVYAGDREVVAFDAATGAERWRSATTTRENAPALAGGLLFAGSADPGSDRLQVFAADGCGAATCAPLWSAALPSVTGEIGAILQPAVAGGLVFVAGDGGLLAAFDAAGCGAATCEPLWTHDVGSAITGAPAVSNGQVYVGTADGRLVAFGLPSA